VGNVGSKDASERIVRTYGARVITIVPDESLSWQKNQLITIVKDGWILFVEPHERLVWGEEEILRACQKDDKISYHVQVLQGTTMTKEVRLWHSERYLRFTNPVFETIYDNQSTFLDVVLHTNFRPDLEDTLRRIAKWYHSRETDAQPIYYKACVLLAMGKFDEFIAAAQTYLFKETHGMSSVMMKYYLALVQCYVKGDTASSIKNIIPCLAVYPRMAEFWCLLGDNYYKRREYAKAYAFYQDAMIVGEKRRKSDGWPMEVPKYLEHPQRMMESCRRMLEKSTIIQGHA
jgi:tetratricopeptide (TPR) repeat protein